MKTKVGIHTTCDYFLNFQDILRLLAVFAYCKSRLRCHGEFSPGDLILSMRLSLNKGAGLDDKRSCMKLFKNNLSQLFGCVLLRFV